MTLEIANEISAKLGLNENELLLELAIVMFIQERLTLGQASKLARLHQTQFQKNLAKRKIPIHYGEEELMNDIETLKNLNL